MVFGDAPIQKLVLSNVKKVNWTETRFKAQRQAKIYPAHSVQHFLYIFDVRLYKAKITDLLNERET
jgi:hypothetical protein